MKEYAGLKFDVYEYIKHKNNREYKIEDEVRNEVRDEVRNEVGDNDAMKFEVYEI